jgi:hypothetical protein
MVFFRNNKNRQQQQQQQQSNKSSVTTTITSTSAHHHSAAAALELQQQQQQQSALPICHTSSSHTASDNEDVLNHIPHTSSDNNNEDDDLEQLRESPVAVAWMLQREKVLQERRVVVAAAAAQHHDENEDSSSVGAFSNNGYGDGSASLASDFTPVIRNHSKQQQQHQQQNTILPMPHKLTGTPETLNESQETQKSTLILGRCTTKQCLMMLIVLALVAVATIATSLLMSQQQQQKTTSSASSNLNPSLSPTMMRIVADDDDLALARDDDLANVLKEGGGGGGDSGVVNLPPVDMNEEAAPTPYSATLAPTSSITDTAATTAFPPHATLFYGQTYDRAFGASIALAKKTSSSTQWSIGIGAPSAIINDTLLDAGRVVLYKQVGGDSTPSLFNNNNTSTFANTSFWQLQNEPSSSSSNNGGGDGISLLTGSATEDHFGTSICMNDNGSIMVVGGPGQDTVNGDRSGAVRTYVYDEDANRYKRLGQALILGRGKTSYFGAAVALNQDGTRLAVGAPYYSGNVRMEGEVLVYEWNDDDSKWVPLGESLDGLSQFDWLGSAVDLSSDGTLLVASAPHDSVNNGYVLAWKWNGNTWDRLGGNSMFNRLSPASPEDRYGQSLSLTETDDGTYRVALGIPYKEVSGRANAGVALVYEYLDDESRWKRVGFPVYHGVSDEEFGYSVKLYGNGNKLIVGAPGYDSRKGLVRFYEYDSAANEWVQSADDVKGTKALDGLGASIAVAEPEDGSNQVMIALGATADDSGRPGYVVSFVQEQ